MTTPIADPRALEAADNFSGITQEHVATWGNSTLVRNARTCRKEGFLAGWEARSAAGPATREQGSEEKHDDVTAYLEMTDELDRARKNILYWMKKAEKAELVAEMLTSPESTKYVLRQYSTLDSVGRQKIDTLMEALFAIKEGSNA